MPSPFPAVEQLLRSRAFRGPGAAPPISMFGGAPMQRPAGGNRQAVAGVMAALRRMGVVPPATPPPSVPQPGAPPPALAPEVAGLIEMTRKEGKPIFLPRETLEAFSASPDTLQGVAELGMETMVDGQGGVLVGTPATIDQARKSAGRGQPFPIVSVHMERKATRPKVRRRR
jgi:hypothetical protein